MTVAAEVKGCVSQDSGDSPGHRVQEMGPHGWRNHPAHTLVLDFSPPELRDHTRPWAKPPGYEAPGCSHPCLGGALNPMQWRVPTREPTHFCPRCWPWSFSGVSVSPERKSSLCHFSNRK